MNNQNKLHGENVIPAGYKRTEVGVIPNDWVEIDLNSIVSGLEAGVSVNSIDQVDAYSHGKHILKTSCVSHGHFDGYEKKSILPTDVKRAKCSPVKGGIIVSRMNTPALVGEVGYVAESNLDSFLPDRLWQMKFKKDVAHNPKWLATLLSFPPFSKKIKDTATGTSGSMKNISKSAFLSLKLPWPTLKEQNIIGTVLSDADALITAHEQLIAKKQAIKTATMQQLLTGRTRLPQFSKYHDGAIKDYKTSELGKIPKDWKITSIGDLFSISAGGDLRVDEFSDIKSELHPHPIYSNAISNFGLYGYCQSYDYIGEYLTITARGGIGHAVARKGSFCAIGRLLVLNPKGTSNVKFFEEYINQYLSFANESTGVPQLTAPQVAKYLVNCPSIEEQTAIATILSDMDAELSILEQKLAKVRDLKQGMMQQLLTGRIRLPLDHQP